VQDLKNNATVPIDNTLLETENRELPKNFAVALSHSDDNTAILAASAAIKNPTFKLAAANVKIAQLGNQGAGDRVRVDAATKQLRKKRDELRNAVKRPEAEKHDLQFAVAQRDAERDNLRNVVRRRRRKGMRRRRAVRSVLGFRFRISAQLMLTLTLRTEWWERGASEGV
jgi:hypothetical protein